MAARKDKKQFGIDDIISIFGVVLFLLALLVFLSGRTRLRGLACGMTFLFGIAGFYLLSFGLAFLGVHMLFHRQWKAFKVRIYIGLPFLVYGLLALASAIALPNEATPVATLQESFFAKLNAIQGGDGIGYYADWSLGGGVLGNLLAFQASSPGKWLPILIAGLLILLGLVLLFFPLIRKLFKAIHTHHVLAKSRRHRPSEEPISVGGPVEPTEQPPLEAPEMLPPVPPREEKPLFDRTPTPLASFSFEPAGSVQVVTRREMRQQTEACQAAPTQTSAYQSPYSRPLRHSGLQEAFFDPDEEEVEPKGYHEIPATPIASSVPVPPAPTPVVTPVPPVQPAPTQPVRPVTEQPIEMPLPKEETPFFEPPAEPIPSLSAEEEPEPFDSFDFGAPIEEMVPEPPLEPSPSLPNGNPSPILGGNPEDEIPDAKPLPPYQYPPKTLLTIRESEQDLEAMEIECLEKTEIINKTFSDLSVGATVVGHTIGPSVTRFAIQPNSDVSVATLGRFIKDIEVRLGGVPTRFAERVAGMTTCALEVANRVARTVSFIELFDALPPKKEGKATLRVPFGLDISGEVKEADFAEFPHMLVAGTTGSGKSIFAHGLLLSLLMRNRPEELKLVLVDPKRVEMSKYKDLPHLLCPIIKEPNEARNALKRLCDEMERRLKIFDIAGVRDIKEFNEDYCVYAHKQKMPYIVLFIDEFSDLVQSCKDVSEFVLRIGQKARAAGIHMILATQRPDVKVITGTIKANIPVKVALTVSSAVDSTTILGQGGAEDLNGKGDMLIDCVQIAKKEFVRAQGCFCDPHELRAVTDFIRAQQAVDYDPNFLHLDEEDEPENTRGMEGITTMGDASPSPADLRNASNEEKYRYIRSVIITRDTASISSIQREFGLGFPRAGKIFARLQAEGIVAQSSDAPGSSKGCKVLVHELPPEEE